MKIGHDKPFVIATPKPVGIDRIRHGVTEVFLSDGRVVRLTIHVEGIKPATDKIDLSYNVVVEVMVAPSAPIMDQHEPLQ